MSSRWDLGKSRSGQSLGTILVHRVLEIGSISHETLLSPTFQAFCPVLRVERTFGWFNYWRRLSKDYEVLPETSEAFIYIGMTRLMLRRLA